MARTGRPRAENRDDLADTTLSLRVTKFERDGLDELARRQTEKLHSAGGQVSANSYARSLIRRELEANGITKATLQNGSPKGAESPAQEQLPIFASDAPATPATSATSNASSAAPSSAAPPLSPGASHLNTTPPATSTTPPAVALSAPAVALPAPAREATQGKPRSGTAKPTPKAKAKPVKASAAPASKAKAKPTRPGAKPKPAPNKTRGRR